MERKLKIIDRGLIRIAKPGTRHATFTYPNVISVSNGSLLATTRCGPSKDTEDETCEIYKSADNGKTWFQIPFPAPNELNGVYGVARSLHLTEIEDGHIIGMVMWLDRQTYPGGQIYNEAMSAGACMPMRVMLADSYDCGMTWSEWRVVDLPGEVGPPSITSRLQKGKDGTLVLFIETNKNYLDNSRWHLKIAAFHSKDGGKTWGDVVYAPFDPTGRINYWDHRVSVAPDGRFVGFAWMHDMETGGFINVHRHISNDNGYTWSDMEDVGFTDQPSVPAILPDGRTVVAWVDRYNTMSIRARFSNEIDSALDCETEVVIYEHKKPTQDRDDGGKTERKVNSIPDWCYGQPCAEALSDGSVMVVYYAGTLEAMDLCWVKLSVPEKQGAL